MSYWTKRRRIRDGLEKFLNDHSTHPDTDFTPRPDIGEQVNVSVTDEVNSAKDIESIVFDEAGVDDVAPQHSVDEADNSDSDIDYVTPPQHSGTDECSAGKLADWVSEFNVYHNAVTALLHVLPIRNKIYEYIYAEHMNMYVSCMTCKSAYILTYMLNFG